MMKDRNFKKIVSFFTLLLFTYYYGDVIPSPPGGGVGGDTPGSPATPINMFIIPLAVVAFFMIVYFTRKRDTKLS